VADRIDRLSPAPPVSPAPSDARVTAAPELRRHVLHLVLAVVALDVVAIGAYELLRIEARDSLTRQLYMGGWTLVTLVVVLTFMARIRAARLRARRARSATAGGRP
jgi:cytochrome bd-type quinol oxidase subunit 1